MSRRGPVTSYTSSGVAGLGQRGDGDVSDVVDVDERLGDVASRKGDLAGEHGVEEQALAEVLGEEARPQDGPVDAGLLHRLLCGERALLATPRQQHEPAHAGAFGLGGEGADVVVGAGEADSGK